MSGSAALSAAKRRRAVSTDEKPPPTSKTNTTTTTRQRGQQINPLQVLNQHHMKLDVLYERQDKINKMLNIEESVEGEESEENLIDRLENIEKQFTNKTSVGNENKLLQQIDDYKNEVDELRKIILNVQSHSVNVSLEMLEMKKKFDNVNEPDEELEIDITDKTETQNHN
jgi:uncharacterized coiled-coil DUF342 family protein